MKYQPPATNVTSAAINSNVCGEKKPECPSSTTVAVGPRRPSTFVNRPLPVSLAAAADCCAV